MDDDKFLLKEPDISYGNYTYADYLTWDFEEIVELIKGKIIKKAAAAPRRIHQRLAGNLYNEFHQFLKGEKVKVQPGDVIIIPAGVGHKCLSHDSQFTVVGAYPNGMQPNLKKGEAGERPKADRNIANVPLPETDPLLGRDGGLVGIWGK